MTTKAEKIEALAWGIYALELRVKEMKPNETNPLQLLAAREVMAKAKVLTEMKAEMEAEQ